MKICDPEEDAARGGDAAGGAHIAALTITPTAHDLRLDKALTLTWAETEDPALLSRSRAQSLIAAGAVSAFGRTVSDAKRKVKAGETFTVAIPAPAPAEAQAENIPLDVVHEDADLIVINKSAGMAVHPAPGSETGTLVNALLHHCGDTLQGVGGELRPGVVHRIDKLTSGLIVAAKTQTALAGLQAHFKTHDIERLYLALVWGAPDLADPRLMGLEATSRDSGWLRIEAALGRHPHDRKRMAVRPDGRVAVTRARTAQVWRAGGKPLASLVECRLETGRTHQIRVHLNHVGFPLIGDPIYGRPRALSRAVPEAAAAALRSFARQGLHAATLGFRHPITGADLRFEASPPEDLATLIGVLDAELGSG